MPDRRLETHFSAADVTANEIYKFLTALWLSQNNLAWSRVYAVLAVESATLAASYHLRGVPGSLVLGIGTFVGFILYRLMVRDWQCRDQQQLLDLLDRVHKPLDIRLLPLPPGRLSHGRFLLNLLFAVLLVSNLATLSVLLCHPALLPVGVVR